MVNRPWELWNTKNISDSVLEIASSIKNEVNETFVYTSGSLSGSMLDEPETPATKEVKSTKSKNNNKKKVKRS